MSKLIGRKPVEVNISSPKQNHIPYFNESTRLWETENINAFITGSNTFIGNQTISGSLFISGNVFANNLNGVVSGSTQVTGALDFRYVLVGDITQTTWDNIANKPGGIVSGSQQLTGSYDTRYVLSGSITQTTWDNIAAKPAGIISGSSQLSGTTIDSLSGSFTGSFRGDGSNLNGLVGVGSGVRINSGSTFMGTAGTLQFSGSGIGISVNDSTASIEFRGIATGTGVALDTVNFAQLSQSISADTWSFLHNLDNQHPTITVYDENNQVIQPLRIEAMTTSSMDIVFSTARRGYAVASMGGVSTQGTSKRLEVTTPSDTWIFQHNIGDKYPVFQVFGSNGDVVIPSRIETVDSGQAKIYFPYATTGYVVASVGGGLPSISASYEGYTLQVQGGYATWQDIVSASVSNAVSSSYVLYSNVANKPTLVSGSSQITISSTTGYTGFSSSLDSRFVSLENFSSSLNATFATDSELSAISGAISASLTLISGSLNSSIVNLNSFTSSFSQSVATSISESNSNITSLSSSVYTSDNTQNGRLNNLESKSASVDISISNINSYTSSLKSVLSISGQDLTINGNLIIAGTSSVINSETLNISSSIIELNYGGTAVKSGIYTKDATGASLVSGSLLWDATNDQWIAGKSGSESKILLAGGDGVVSGSLQITLQSTTGQLSASRVDGLNLSQITSGLWTASIANNEFKIINNGSNLIQITSGSNIINNGTVTIIANSFANDYALGYTDFGEALNIMGDVIITGSIVANNLNGIVSGSSQLTSSYDTRYVVSGSITQTTWDNIASKPAGIISGSEQTTASLDLRYLQVGDNISTMVGYGTLALTGSNNFIGNQTFTGSVSISGSLNLFNANIDTSRYLHSQSAASTTWTVNHSLEYDYPSVTIYDNTNKVIIPDEITRISNNQLTITFASAESGNAHVSVGGISNIAGDRYLYTQSTPASTWTITHALNYKYVNVDVYDNNDQLMLPQTVTATNNNTLTLVFATPTSGNATISKGGAKVLNGLTDLGNGSYQFTGSLVVTGEVDAQNFNTTSDISLKTNLELIENSLDKVEKLNGYTFDWVENYNNDGVKQIGMIAQEVYAVQPELVTKKEILIGNTYEEVMLLDYSKVTSLLIGAVKELSEKVKQLENKIGQ